MKIKPISFTRAIKVNAPLNEAQQAVVMINSCGVVPKREILEIQEKLTDIFADSEEYRAQAVELQNGDVYILSGKESLTYERERLLTDIKIRKIEQEEDFRVAPNLKYQAITALDFKVKDIINSSFWKDFSINLARTNQTITKVDLVHNETDMTLYSSGDYSYFA